MRLYTDGKRSLLYQVDTVEGRLRISAVWSLQPRSRIFTRMSGIFESPPFPSFFSDLGLACLALRFTFSAFNSSLFSHLRLLFLACSRLDTVSLRIRPCFPCMRPMSRAVVGSDALLTRKLGLAHQCQRRSRDEVSGIWGELSIPNCIHYVTKSTSTCSDFLKPKISLFDYTFWHCVCLQS